MMDNSIEQVRDCLRQIQEQIQAKVYEDLDRTAVIMVAGSGHKRPDILLRIATATGRSIQSVVSTLDELSRNVNQLQEKARVSAEEFRALSQELPAQIGYNRAYTPPSRRGRNIKPDTSRRARYTIPKSHE